MADTGTPTKLLGLRETAERIGIPEATLRFWRHRGDGPPGRRIGRRVMFREADIEAWIREQFRDDPAVRPNVALPVAPLLDGDTV